MKAVREALNGITPIFFMSRIAILLISVLAMRLPPLGQLVRGASCDSQSQCLLLWYHFDSIVYVQLAAHGYSNLSETVFFPLWPVLMHLLGVLFGASIIGYYIAGLVLANVFFYLALLVFYILLQKESFDQDTIKRAVFYLIFSPCSIFFFIGYTESLFLMLCLIVFLALQQERFWLAGLCGFFAVLTRSQGILLVIPFLIVAYLWFRSRTTTWSERLHAGGSLLLLPLGVVTFVIYLWLVWKDPLAFSTQEAISWHRVLTFPLISLVEGIQALLHPSTLVLFLLNLVDIGSVLGVLTILIIGWRHIPLHYSTFSLVMILFSLSYPQGNNVEPLTAIPRYLLVVFPVFLILAVWGKRYNANQLITICSLVLFTLNIVLFVNHYWVA
jgi:Gpi18-like mannosyltransferase